MLHELAWCNEPGNPFCPPAWRWLRANYLVENKRRCRAGDDARMREATRFCRALRRCKDEGDQAKLARKMPALYQAWQLYQTSSFQRWEVEARFLADETDEVIARKCQLLEDVVTVFHDIFFSVRHRLHARDWVMTVAIGRRARLGLTEDDHEILLKLFALKGGPLVLDSLVRFFRHPAATLAAQDGLDAVDQNDQHLHRLIRQSIRILTLPADAVHLPGLVVLLALLDRKKPAGGPSPVDLIDHFLEDSDPDSLLRFASAGTETVSCKRPA